MASVEDRPKVGVSTYLIKKENDGSFKILIGLRKSSLGSGTLQTPGGHLEYGESWAECASREGHEETGYLVPAERFTFHWLTNDVFTMSKKHYITIFMRGEVTEAEANDATLPRVCEPDKCEWWKWFTVEEFKELPKKYEMFLPMANLMKDVELGNVSL